jgi:hypothetical protein
MCIIKTERRESPNMALNENEKHHTFKSNFKVHVNTCSRMDDTLYGLEK